MVPLYFAAEATTHRAQPCTPLLTAGTRVCLSKTVSAACSRVIAAGGSCLLAPNAGSLKKAEAGCFVPVIAFLFLNYNAFFCKVKRRAEIFPAAGETAARSFSGTAASSRTPDGVYRSRFRQKITIFVLEIFAKIQYD